MFLNLENTLFWAKTAYMREIRALFLLTLIPPFLFETLRVAKKEGIEN